MKLGIIGSGCGGLFLSIITKSKNKDLEVFVIDQNKIIGRKLYVTGNGRCNLGNLNLDSHSYNNVLALNLVKKYGINSEISFLNSIGIETRNLDNLIYPFSLSAKSFTDYLVSYAKKIGVKFINEEKVLNYKNNGKFISLTTDKNEYNFDKLAISTGGKSNKNLGSDGSFFDILKKHKYSIENLVPGLAPIKTFEATKMIENERIKCKVLLKNNGKNLYEETGEVLFKKDGLSGICIMNISSIIARKKLENSLVVLDVFPDKNEEEILKDFTMKFKKFGPSFLDGIFSKKMCEFIVKNACNKNQNSIELVDVNKISKFVKKMKFTHKENYDFNDSQVSIGGVDLSCVNSNFESKLEKNIFIFGECLNLDGLCGGYNIMLCYSEAQKISENI